MTGMDWGACRNWGAVDVATFARSLKANRKRGDMSDATDWVTRRRNATIIRNAVYPGMIHPLSAGRRRLLLGYAIGSSVAAHLMILVAIGYWLGRR